MKKLLSVLCIAALLCCAAAGAQEVVSYDIVYSSANPIPEIAANVRPAIVEVGASAEEWDPVTRVASVTPTSSASGTYFRSEENGGYILTNYHVVAEADCFEITWLSGETMDATLVGYDNGTDIAVLRFTDPAPEGAHPVPLGDSDALQIGELAICIGNPGSSGKSLFGTVTAGIISGLDREDVNANNFSRSVNVIQTDAAINTGNSGGALLNARGEMIGIPTLKLMISGDTVYEGLGFCIPINSVRSFIAQIIDNGKVVRPRLGLTIVNIDGPDEPMRKYPPIGVQVAEVEAGNPSAQAGIRVNDIITEINGVRVKSITETLKEIDRCAAGDTVEMKVYRYYDENGELTGTYEELHFSVVLQMLD